MTAPQSRRVCGKSMTSEEYWLERTLKLEAESNRQCKITAREIEKLYDSALENTQARMLRLFNRFQKRYGLTPEQATHLLTVRQTQDARERLLRQMAKIKDPIFKEKLRAAVDAPAYALRISQLQVIRDEVTADMLSTGVEFTQITKERLTDLYKNGYYRTAFNLSQEQGFNVPFQTLTDRRANAAVERYWSASPKAQAGNYSSRIWSNTEKLAEDVREIVTNGMMTGQSYDFMAEELRLRIGVANYKKRITGDGHVAETLTGSGEKYRASLLVRTEGSYISGQATLEGLKDAGRDMYSFVAVLERHTCKVCGNLDRKEFFISEQLPGRNCNPMHPGCRCHVAPKVSTEMLARMKRASNMEGRKDVVPASMTFPQWKEKFVDNG